MTRSDLPRPIGGKQSASNHSSIPLFALMASASVMLMLHASLHSSILASLIFLTVASILWRKEVGSLLNWIGRWGNRHGIDIFTLVFVVVGIVFWVDYMATPASAQFFSRAESWMTGAFPGVDAAVVQLVFNVLRGIFIIYLGISLVRVIAAARNDEDWQTLARTPLIILIAVTLGDILAGLITGGGAA